MDPFLSQKARVLLLEKNRERISWITRSCGTHILKDRADYKGQGSASPCCAVAYMASSSSSPKAKFLTSENDVFDDAIEDSMADRHIAERDLKSMLNHRSKVS